MLQKQKISTGLIGHFPYLTFLYLFAWYHAENHTSHFHSRHGYNYRPDRPPLTLPTLHFLTLPYLTLHYPTLPFPTSPYPTLPYPPLPHPTLPYPPLPHSTLPYLTLPYLTLPYPTLPYLTFPYLLAWYHAENHTCHFHSRHGCKYLHFPVSSCCFIVLFYKIKPLSIFFLTGSVLE